MELKRILARDTRSATERAMSLYGPDVLIIANHRVGGQTELVVAVEMASASAGQRHVFDRDNPFAKAAPDPKEPTMDLGVSFGDHLGHALFGKEASVPVAMRSDPLLKADPLLQSGAQRDEVRSKEIVAFVVEELAALRREFRVSQQANEWQSGQSVGHAVQPVVQAMHQAGVPVGLRTLLVDSIKDHDSTQDALNAIRELLTASLKRGGEPGAFEGVHGIAGPSGAGKTLMAARLALHTAAAVGSDKVAFISYQDTRIGAWNQTNLRCAQIGIDCYRAQDASTLGLLLAELSQRTLVLIDTPGVQMIERIKEIKLIHPECIMHAVLPADASAVSVERVLKDASTRAGFAWDSLMISKLDEATAPWALLQYMCNEADVPVLSAASGSERLTDLVMGFTTAQLVNLAVTQLMPTHTSQMLKETPMDANAFNARAKTFSSTRTIL
jgi:flagellar biosynthesis GTPase FlhF